MDITPTNHTHARLAGHQMIFKVTRTGFLVAVKTDTSAADIRSVVQLTADLRLSFILTISDPRFFNYTEVAAAKPGFYRFSNGSANAVAGKLFLTAPVPDFDATRAYEAGAIYAVSAADVINLLLSLIHI